MYSQRLLGAKGVDATYEQYHLWKLRLEPRTGVLKCPTFHSGSLLSQDGALPPQTGFLAFRLVNADSFMWMEDIPQVLSPQS